MNTNELLLEKIADEIRENKRSQHSRSATIECENKTYKIEVDYLIIPEFDYDQYNVKHLRGNCIQLEKVDFDGDLLELLSDCNMAKKSIKDYIINEIEDTLK